MTDEEFALAEWITYSDTMVQVAILVHYGFDYDVAASFDDATRFGFLCIMNRLYEQREFDFGSRKWRDMRPPKPPAGS